MSLLLVGYSEFPSVIRHLCVNNQTPPGGKHFDMIKGSDEIQLRTLQFGEPRERKRNVESPI
jgi:hypothetical protein